MSAPLSSSDFKRPTHVQGSCAACNVTFGGIGDESAPVSLQPCGHAVCASCASLILADGTLACTICHTTVTTTVRNIGLAILAEKEEAGAGSVVKEGPLPLYRRPCYNHDCVWSKDTPVVVACTECEGKLYCLVLTARRCAQDAKKHRKKAVEDVGV